MFKNKIFEMITSPEMGHEFWSLYCEVREAADTMEMRGLIKYRGSKLDVLKEARTGLNQIFFSNFLLISIKEE